MSRIRSRNTKLDIAMRDLLNESGLDYVMYPSLEGNPDFMVGKKVVVFCDSSFWHGRNWPTLRKHLMKGSNAGYWVDHIRRNRLRDREVTRRLEKMGYLVVRLWDSDVLKNPEGSLKEIRVASSTLRKDPSLPTP